MDPFLDAAASWATVLGTTLALFGVVQSRAWLLAVGALLSLISIGALVYARRQRAIVESASLSVLGRSLDSLNAARLRHRLNRSLVMQRVENISTVDDEDLTVEWTCTGYCKAARETMIEFSVDADVNIPFGDLECLAFDLHHDPDRLHGIRPMLVGPDGISKRIAVPLLAPLAAEEPFNVFLRCRLLRCLTAGVDYATATISFAQDRVPQYAVRLRFLNGAPEWVRTYECRGLGGTRLLKDLRPVRLDGGVTEYADVDNNVPAESARVYVFYRPRKIDSCGTLAA